MNKLFILIFFSFSYTLSAQTFEKLHFNFTYDEAPLTRVLAQLEQDSDFSFYYQSDWIDTINVAVEKGMEVQPFINSTLERAGMSYIQYQRAIVLVNQPSIENFQYESSRDNVDNSSYTIVGKGAISLDKDVRVSGFIRDGTSGEPLIGASIIVEGAGVGAVTNVNGHYTIQMPGGKHEVTIDYVGYEQSNISIFVKSSGILNAELFEETVRLEEITISARGHENGVNENVAGREIMTIQAIKSLPAFLGEVDPVKGLISLPGVSAVGEGTAGYNVRGGEPGQNLLLQDGAILYSSSHMFGFFSAFNQDLLNDVVLYKGGGPANFGGRVSSVLNVNLRNGNTKEFRASGGLGIISSRLTFEGPINKDRTSFIIGGRVSYLNWLLKRMNDVNLRKSSADFHDLNFKINHLYNKNNAFTLSTYMSEDEFQFASDTTYSWSSRQASLNWNHVFNNKLLSSMGFVWSEYHSDIDNNEPVNEFGYTSAIKNASVSIEFDWMPVKSHQLNIGASSLMYLFDPGRFEPGANNLNGESIHLKDEKGVESAIYINDEFSVTSRLSLVYGLRFSNYVALGGQTYIYDPKRQRREESVTDTLHFGNNEVAKSFNGLEPRVSARYLLSPTLSIRMSYYRTKQYVHLISNTTAISPVDYWKQSGYNIDPSRADQVTFGVFKNWNDNTYEISSELYYKDIYNAIDYKDGTSILLNENLEEDLLQGEGRAYGAEFLLRKNKGKLTGWLSYTYSRSERRFYEPSYKEGTINKGNFYPANYDKPHDISLVLDMKAGRRFSMGLNFSYSTGRPITVPISKYSYQDVLSVLNYSERNQYRVPAYHRLDLSFTYKSSLKKEKKLKGEWVLSLYNVYGRRNPYSVFFTQRGNAFRLSVLGSIFPSLSYNFKI